MRRVVEVVWRRRPVDYVAAAPVEEDREKAEALDRIAKRVAARSTSRQDIADTMRDEIRGRLRPSRRERTSAVEEVVDVGAPRARRIVRGSVAE